MRPSPRRRGICHGDVSVTHAGQLSRLPLGELRQLADEEHGIKSASLLSRADLLEKLGSHYETSHGVELSLLKQVLSKLRGGDVQTKEEKTETEELSLIHI